jgi:hypothetical protein
MGKAMGMDFEKMRQIAFGGSHSARPADISSPSPVRHRSELEQFVDTRPPEQRQARPEQSVEHARRNAVPSTRSQTRHPMFDDSVFPDKPIVLEE